MNQSVTFDTASGIDLSGWWSNPSTGESYQIVDQFFQDNSLYVKTMQGQIINFNRIQNFVRSDKPIDRPVEKPQMQNSKLLEGLLPEDSGILEEDLDLISGRHIKSSKNPESSAKETSKSVNEMILDKMFSKAPAPEVNLDIQWNWDRLQNTLETLVDTMDVSEDEISEYVYRKFCSDLAGEIGKQIRSKLFHVEKQHD